MFRAAALALILSALVNPASGAVNPIKPEAQAELPRTFRHIPKGCSNTKPREIIRLRLFKMDKDGKLIAVGVVLIPQGC